MLQEWPPNACVAYWLLSGIYILANHFSGPGRAIAWVCVCLCVQIITFELDDLSPTPGAIKNGANLVLSVAVSNINKF